MAFKSEDYLSYNQDGLDAQKIFKSLVTPRPIALITSLSPDGIVNAAPFSYFNIISTNPCLVSISIGKWNGKRKDTAENILSKGEFVANICPPEFEEILNLTSKPFPFDVSEIEAAQLNLIASSKIAPPRIAGTLAQLECILDRVIEVGNDPVDLVVGQVVNIHISKGVFNLEEARLDPQRYTPIARSIGNTYCTASYKDGVLKAPLKS